jgi:hypothetical protein
MAVMEDMCNDSLSDELLAAFLDGNTTLDETERVLAAVTWDGDVQEVIETSFHWDDIIDAGNFTMEENAEAMNIFSDDYDRICDMSDSNVINQINNSLNMEREIKYANGHIGEDAKIDVSSDVFQWYEDTCAIKSQQLVLEKYGVQVSQEELIDVATKNGWYSPGDGTPMNCVGNLLDHYGVPSTSIVGANADNIIAELAQGHQVIVGVDAGELQNGGIMESLKDLFIGDTANHALIVAGIDTSDPDNEYVILKDPGTGDVAKPYPLDDFLDAWKDSECFMVTTHDPAYLEFSPELANFDYQAMHIDHVAGMGFDDFIAENGVIMPDDMMVIDPMMIDQWMHDSFDDNLMDDTVQPEEI